MTQDPSNDSRLDVLRHCIRDIPDFPKPGILFKDITPLIGDARAFRATIELLAERVANRNIGRIVAIESRGFVFGAALALQMGIPLALVRKPGKLPFTKQSVSYALEYGEGTLEMHIDAVKPGEHVLVLDDLLATGGTARAAAELVEGQGALVSEYAFVVELDFLHGRQKLGGKPVFSLIQYP